MHWIAITPVRWWVDWWTISSGPYLRYRSVFMGDVAAQKVARGAYHLNRVEFNLERLVHGVSPHGMAGDVEMICAACPVPEGVASTNVLNVVLDIRLNPSNAYSLILSEARDREREVEEVHFGRIVCEEMAFEEGFLEVALACVVPLWLRIRRL